METFTFHSTQRVQLTGQEVFARDWTDKQASEKKVVQSSFGVMPNHELCPFDLQVDYPAMDYHFIIMFLQESLGISIGLYDSRTNVRLVYSRSFVGVAAFVGGRAQRRHDRWPVNGLRGEILMLLR
jgi:hypothetical protein